MNKTLLLTLAGAALMACTPADEPANAATETTTTMTTTAPPSDTTPAPPTASTDPAADTCNMTQYSALVGQPVTDPAVPPASATVRIIRPGDQVTMDFQATRVNFDVDANGVITAIRCG